MLLEPVVQGRADHRAGRGALAVGIVLLVEDPHRFDDPVVQIAPVLLPGEVTPHVHRPELFFRVALVDPLGDGAAGAGGPGDAHRVHAAGHEEIGHQRRFAQHEGVVRGEALRADLEMPDLGRLQVRKALETAFHERFELGPVLGQLGELPDFRDPFHPVGFGDLLEPAEEDSAGFFLEVGAPVEVAHRGKMLVQTRDGHGDRMHVFGGVQRQAHPDAPADGAAPHPGAANHGLAVDGPLGGAHAAGPAVFHNNIQDRAVFHDFGPAVAGPLGQRLGGADRIYLPVAGQVEGRYQPLGAHPGHHGGCFGQRNFIHLDPEGLGHGRTAQPFAAPVIGLADPEGAGAHEPGFHPGLLAEGGVQLSGIARQVGHLPVLAQLGQQPGRGPGRPRGQFLAFQKHHVGVPLPG